MDVKDVFELRSQGRLEEAYVAIRRIYANDKGPRASLAMFWTEDRRGEENSGCSRAYDAQCARQGGAGRQGSRELPGPDGRGRE